MIKEIESALFTRWQQDKGYSSFMADGVFDEDSWLSQDLKILYVLKEANWENGNEDLCE